MESNEDERVELKKKRVRIKQIISFLLPRTFTWKWFSSFAVKFWHLYKPDDSNWTLIIVNWYVCGYSWFRKYFFGLFDIEFTPITCVSSLYQRIIFSETFFSKNCWLMNVDLVWLKWQVIVTLTFSRIFRIWIEEKMEEIFRKRKKRKKII
jgi:hypothetical protein